MEVPGGSAVSPTYRVFPVLFISLVAVAFIQSPCKVIHSTVEAIYFFQSWICPVQYIFCKSVLFTRVRADACFQTKGCGSFGELDWFLAEPIIPHCILLDIVHLLRTTARILRAHPQEKLSGKEFEDNAWSTLYADLLAKAAATTLTDADPCHFPVILLFAFRLLDSCFGVHPPPFQRKNTE